MGWGVVNWLRITFLHFFVFSLFSLSAFLLFYLDAENVLFHPVKTILDYSIKFLGSPQITNVHFLKKCDEYCLK